MVRYCMKDGKFNSKKTSSQSTGWIILLDLFGIQIFLFVFSIPKEEW